MKFPSVQMLAEVVAQRATVSDQFSKHDGVPGASAKGGLGTLQVLRFEGVLAGGRSGGQRHGMGFPAQFLEKEDLAPPVSRPDALQEIQPLPDRLDVQGIKNSLDPVHDALHLTMSVGQNRDQGVSIHGLFQSQVSGQRGSGSMADLLRWIRA